MAGTNAAGGPGSGWRSRLARVCAAALLLALATGAGISQAGDRDAAAGPNSDLGPRALELPVPAEPLPANRRDDAAARRAAKGAEQVSPRPRPQAHGASSTAGHTTVEQTIRGAGGTGFQQLELGPGEPYIVREELAKAKGGRAARRRSLIYSGQITDFQLPDEESPARVEFFERNDPTGAASSAHRPQEALVAHEVELSIRQMNLFAQASPVPQGDGSRAPMANAVMTGDLADNQQLNETEWVRNLLSGGGVTPDSGDGSPAAAEGLCPPGSTLTTDGDRYAGVQDYDDYPVDPGPDGNQFWDPDDVRGDYAAAGWPEYPQLLDQAQRRFPTAGVAVPTYVVFGNHDMEFQGTVATLQPYEEISTGCVKPLADFGVLTGETDPTILPSSQLMIVPPDDDRQFVDKAQFKSIFRAGSQADGFGFDFIDPEEEEASNGAAGYYAFDERAPTGSSQAKPAKPIRFIVLDTPSEGGLLTDLAAGNIDDPQFDWLRGELEAASRRDQLIVVWGHHATGSLGAQAADEVNPCIGPAGEADDDHDVNGISHDSNPSCDRDPRESTPIHDGEDLTNLFNRFPHVIAYVAGHSHENRINPLETFWEIKSPAIADWPPQHRLVEVMNNRDCTLSIFATMLDHTAPAETPPSGSDADSFSLQQIAAIGRTVTFNDPEHGEEDRTIAEGAVADRNAELLLSDPREKCAKPDGNDDGDGDDGDGDDRGQPGNRDSDGDDANPERTSPVTSGSGTGSTDEGAGGALPFTGLSVLALVIVAGGLLAGGRLLRRASGGSSDSA